MHCRLFAALVDHAEQVLGNFRCVGGGANGFEQTGRVDSPHRLHTAVRRLNNPRLLRIGQVGADGNRRSSGIAHFVGAEDFERVLVPAFHQGSNLIQLNASSHNHVLQN